MDGMEWDGMSVRCIVELSFRFEGVYRGSFLCIYEWMIGGRAPIVSFLSRSSPSRGSKQGATTGTDFPNRNTRGGGLLNFWDRSDRAA